MTDAEISMRLALAIGYSPWCAVCHNSCCAVKHETGPDNSGCHWYDFDYRDPAVIWPIAEKFDCFPGVIGRKWTSICTKWGFCSVEADSAAKAVALAVIKANEKA